MKYPIYQPDIHNYTSSLYKAIEDGWFSSQGEFIEKAASLVKSILGVKYVVMVNNGTSATHLLYKALKFKYPTLTKIYVPNNVFVAVWNAGLYEYPPSAFSMLQMDPTTLNMCVDEEYIRNLEPNSAVVVVHNVGNVVNVPRLKRLRPDIVFVEDVCEAFLECYEDKKTGTESLCAAVSFFANKIITSGEGGLFYTNDEELYNYIYKSCHHGTTTERYVYDVLGYNYRMTNLQAALLYDQLNDVDSILQTKRNIYDRYVKLFGKEVSTTGLWMMILRLSGLRYEDVYPFALRHGVDTRPMFYDIHKHTHLRCVESTPQSIGHEELVMIPSSPTLTPFDQTYIWAVIEQFKRGISIDIQKSTPESVRLFLTNPIPPTFRYFNTRDVSVCATHELSIVGFVDERPIAYAHIDDRWIGLCVLPEYQSKGYGKLFLDFLIAYAKISGIAPLRLSVDKGNQKAVEMYMRRGFTIVRENETVSFMEKTQ